MRIVDTVTDKELLKLNLCFRTDNNYSLLELSLSVDHHRGCLTFDILVGRQLYIKCELLLGLDCVS